MRIDRAGAYSREMLQARKATGTLQAAHINRRIAEDFTGRAAIRTRVQSVRELAAFLRDDRHDRCKVDIEAEDAQQLARNFPECSHAGEIAVLTDRARRRHRGKDGTQTIDQAALLIDATQRSRRHYFPTLIEHLSYLLRRFDVAAEENDAARFDLVKKFACLLIDAGAGKADEEKLSDLLLERKRQELVCWHWSPDSFAFKGRG